MCRIRLKHEPVVLYGILIHLIRTNFRMDKFSRTSRKLEIRNFRADSKNPCSKHSDWINFRALAFHFQNVALIFAQVHANRGFARNFVRAKISTNRVSGQIFHMVEIIFIPCMVFAKTFIAAHHPFFTAIYFGNTRSA